MTMTRTNAASLICNGLLKAAGISLLVLSSIAVDSALARADESVSRAARIPVLENLGVVPVRFEGEANDFAALGSGQRFVRESFSRAVRDARRFKVLDDDLVSGLWSSAKGRSELVAQFELQAFTSLNVVPRPDTITFVGRLLSPELGIYLQESEAVSATWFANASQEEMLGKLQELMFRLFNRIPVDVSVTSVQGAFITISGGKEQAVHIGDEMTLVRVRVASRHPANDSWLSFDTETLGKATVVEVKRHAAVARLDALTREGAVTPGDGARVPAISGRARFARLAATPQFRDAGRPETIIVPPLYDQGTAAKPNAMDRRAPQQPPVQIVKPGRPVDPDVRAPRSEAPAAKPTEVADEDSPEEPADESTSGETKSAAPGSKLSVDRVVRTMADDVTVHLGAQSWSVSGPVSESGKFPIWLVNTVGADVTRGMMANLKLGYGGSVGFGQTNVGNYMAYRAVARIYYEADVPMFRPLLKTWRAGGLGGLSGLSVPEGTFGGGDFLRAGGFAGLTGEIDFGSATGETFDWFAEFALLPVNIGRFGYAEKMSTIESAMGWSFQLGGFKPAGRGDIEWGGRFGYSSENLTLANDAQPQMTWLQLMALARYQFH